MYDLTNYLTGLTNWPSSSTILTTGTTSGTTSPYDWRLFSSSDWYKSSSGPVAVPASPATPPKTAKRAEPTDWLRERVDGIVALGTLG